MVTVHVLAKQKKSKMCRLVKVEGTVAESELEQGKRWTQALMDAAYAGESFEARPELFCAS